MPVVSNFRPADMAAGGQGAPLVPLLDYVLFADQKRGRVLQNIGGIANLTAMPAGSGAEELIAFDTGPGNMVMDALAQKLFGKPFDRNGAIAARGRVLEPVVEQMLSDPLFCAPSPEDCGARGVWARVCGDISGGMPACEPQARGCVGDGNGADR